MAIERALSGGLKSDQRDINQGDVKSQAQTGETPVRRRLGLLRRRGGIKKSPEGVHSSELDSLSSLQDPQRSISLPAGGEFVIGENGNLSPDSSGQTPPTRPEFKRKENVQFGLEFRPIQEEDIDVMIEKDWFKDPKRNAHLLGETINDETLPKNWDDPDQVAKFKKALHDFYFPPSPFIIHAKDGNGNSIRDAEVTRHTLVVTKEGHLAGATSWLEGQSMKDGKPTRLTTGDPWASPADVRRYKQAHTQMHVVAPEFEGQGFGLALLIARTDAIFEAGYDRIVTWVNRVSGYERNQTLFESVGYDEDSERKGRLYFNPTVEGKAIKMWRYVLDKSVWENGLETPDGIIGGRNDAIRRWNERKIGINIRPKQDGI